MRTQTQKLHHITREGTLNTAVFKTNGKHVQVSLLKNGVAAKHVNVPLEVAARVYEKFIDRGYSRHVFVTNIPYPI